MRKINELLSGYGGSHQDKTNKIIHWICASLTATLWLVSVIVFVVAWIGQFYRHNVERKRSSSLKDVRFLLTGPAWLLHFVYRKSGIPY